MSKVKITSYMLSNKHKALLQKIYKLVPGPQAAA